MTLQFLNREIILFEELYSFMASRYVDEVCSSGEGCYTARRPCSARSGRFICTQGFHAGPVCIASPAAASTVAGAGETGERK